MPMSRFFVAEELMKFKVNSYIETYEKMIWNDVKLLSQMNKSEINENVIQHEDMWILVKGCDFQ